MDSNKVLHALIQYAEDKNQSSADVIARFLPYLADEQVTPIANLERLRKTEQRVATLEERINQMENVANMAFWRNIAIFLGMLGSIAGIAALLITLNKDAASDESQQNHSYDAVTLAPQVAKKDKIIHAAKSGKKSKLGCFYANCADTPR